MLFHLRRFASFPSLLHLYGAEALAATQNIETVPLAAQSSGNGTQERNPRILRKLFVGIPSEIYRWFDAFKMLKDCDMFIIPGTDC